MALFHSRRFPIVPELYTLTLLPLQEQVYTATTRGLVRDVISGYNATVFAYGATGAGKTHTMVGSDQEPGIMVRALNDLFRSIDKHGHNYTVSGGGLQVVRNCRFWTTRE